MGDAGGFGEICDGSGENLELNLKVLRPKLLPVYPLFMRGLENPPFSFTQIREQQSCLCDRWDLERPPIMPEGNVDSRFVFITTAPMNEDFEEGRVFSPRYLSGAVFSAYLELLGLGRSSIYLTSASYCRTIMSNDSSEGLKSCMRFKREEFDRLRRAKYFITFGSAPFQMMSGIFGSATSFLGSYFKFEWFEHEAYLIPFPHPAYSADAPYLNDRVLEVMSKMVHE